MAPPSALIGEPPLTDDDTTIVRGLQMWGLSVMKLEGKLHGPTPLLHPEKGFKTPPFRPPPGEYHFETRRPRFLAGACVAIIVMVFITGTRLAIRARSPKLHFGKDDWLIIYGVVWLFVTFEYYTTSLRMNAVVSTPLPHYSIGTGRRRRSWEAYLRCDIS